MTQAVPLEDRVADLEREMAEVRFLATKAESEVSDMQTVLRGHTGVINAIRQDQVKHGEELAGVKADVKTIKADVASVKADVASVRAEMHDGFAKVEERFHKVDERFRTVDERFDKVDERFRTVDERFDKVDERFDKVDQRFRTVDERFDRLEAKVDDNFVPLRRGQDDITKLLTRHLDKSDEKLTDGAGE